MAVINTYIINTKNELSLGYEKWPEQAGNSTEGLVPVWKFLPGKELLLPSSQDKFPSKEPLFSVPVLLAQSRGTHTSSLQLEKKSYSGVEFVLQVPQGKFGAAQGIPYPFAITMMNIFLLKTDGARNTLGTCVIPASRQAPGAHKKSLWKEDGLNITWARLKP